MVWLDKNTSVDSPCNDWVQQIVLLYILHCVHHPLLARPGTNGWRSSIVLVGWGNGTLSVLLSVVL